MSRDMTSGAAAAVNAAVVRPVFFVELDFLSAPVRLWGGVGPLDWDGKTWTGAGDLLAIGQIEEASDGTATTMTGTLSGIPSELAEAIYADDYQGRAATIFLGFFDPTWSLIDAPVQIRTGIMDQMQDTDDGTSAVFTLTTQTAALDQGDNRSWRFTDQIQQQFFPGDDIFKYTTVLQSAPIRWGAASAQTVLLKSLASRII